ISYSSAVTRTSAIAVRVAIGGVAVGDVAAAVALVGSSFALRMLGTRVGQLVAFHQLLERAVRGRVDRAALHVVAGAGLPGGGERRRRSRRRPRRRGGASARGSARSS